MRISFIFITALICSQRPAAAEGPFVTVSIEQACVQAEKERKVVFIDFHTTWCGPCKMLDQRTWPDKKVAAWLSEKTVAMRIDAEEEPRLAGKYRVDGYPTLLFLKPDGTEIGRLVGFFPPAGFIEEADGILSGKDAITRAREKLQAEGENDPMARKKYAKALQRQGLHEEALKEYLWCFDEGLKHRRSFVGVRLSFLLSDIADLGASYPPALAALRERRDTARDAILSGKGSMQSAMEVSSINRYLDTPQETLALYDRLKKEQPESEAVAYLRDNVMEQLLEQRRYAEVAEEVDIKAEIDELLARSQPGLIERLAMLKYSKEQRERIRNATTGWLIGEGGQYYQILIGLGRFEEADALAERLLKVRDDAVTYNELAWNGYLTGAPTEANLAQARKAYELTDGRDVAIIDTLARVLHGRGQREEAIALLRESMKTLTSPRDQAKLNECLADLGGDTAALRRCLVPGAVLAVVLILAVAVFILSRGTGAAARSQTGAARAG